MNKIEKQNDSSYVLVIGATNIDLTLSMENSLLSEEVTLIGKVEMNLGGVRRNIALNLAKLAIPTKLMTVIGEDAYGEQLKKEASENQLDISYSIINQEETTASFVIINDEDGKEIPIDATHSIRAITPDYLKEKVR